MKLVTAAQMVELEQLAINEYGIDALLLMENAARAFCDAVELEWGPVGGKTIAVFCGKGNNGGDGFAISRHLSGRGADVTVVFDDDKDSLKPDAAKNFAIITKMQIPVLPLSLAENRNFDIGIDALLGTGFHGKVIGKTAKMIELLNKTCKKIAAVDVPSGVNCSDGSATEPCVRADLTVTFALAKPGHFLYPAKEYCGKVVVTDISIPKNVLNNFSATVFALDESTAATLPVRKENSHKGTFGKVLIFGGSTGMSGALIMATTAVLKSGAGMVTAAVPETISDAVTAHFPEAMTLPLKTDGGTVTENAADALIAKLQSQQVLLAGCGLGTAGAAQNVLRSLVLACEKPMVIDADGINALAGHIHIVKQKTTPVILTPHPLEFSRICGLSVDEIQANRLQIARQFAEENGVILVLKGADTVVAHPNGHAYISLQSNSGLAKAGSGDVLAGVIAALLAQGVAPEAAANLGVYLHSRAGMLARDNFGAFSMTAGDVLAALPAAFKEAEKHAE